MKRNLAALFSLCAAFAASNIFGQTTPDPVSVQRPNAPQAGAQNSNQHDQMPGMQHQNMPGMEPGQMPAQSQNPAERTAIGPPAPDLLKDVASRPAMQLSQFEQFALATNPTLRQASALMRQSAGQARQIGLLPNPVIGYRGEEIRGGQFGGGEQGGFIQQTFVLGGKLGLRRNIYEQQRREDEIGVTEQRYRVLSDVSQSFYSTLAAQEVVNVRRRLLGIALDAAETAHQLANVGQADAPDVLQAEVEAEQAKVDYTTAQRTFIQEFQILAALVGRADLPVSPLQGDLEHPPDIKVDQIVNQIAQESPSVRRAQQEIARAQAELKSAKRESVPDLQVNAGAQQSFEALSDLNPKPVGLEAFATIGITVPIFNRNQGNVAAARADLERAQGEVTRVQLSLRQSAQPLLQAYQSAQVEASRYKNEMIPRAARAYQLYLTKYQQMGAAYPEVIVSQRTSFQLQVGYINALQQLWMTAIALQNYTLSNGLGAPTGSGTYSTTINLPSSTSGAGTQ
jgi:cobalt-zinc-cadmium efflux system outer membrane protein